MSITPGYIYFAFNPEMPHYLKVGVASFNTSTPQPFRVLMQWQVNEISTAKRAAQIALDDFYDADHPDYFRIDVPKAIDILNDAIQPFLTKALPRDLLNEIGTACISLSQLLFVRDLREEPPKKLSPKTAEALTLRIYNRVTCWALRLQGEGTDPSVLISILDLASTNVEGASQYHRSPGQLATAVISNLELLCGLLLHDLYLSVGTGPNAVPFLRYSSELTKLVANLIRVDPNLRGG